MKMSIVNDESQLWYHHINKVFCVIHVPTNKSSIFDHPVQASDPKLSESLLCFFQFDE